MTVGRVVRLAALALLGGCAKGDAGKGPYAAEVAEAMPKIEQITGLRFKRAPTVKEVSRDELRAYIEQDFREHEGATLPQEQRVLRLFGLVPDTLDLQKFLLAFYLEQVVGYYVPKDKSLQMVKGAAAVAGGRAAVAGAVTHELVHALQDQYMNLDSIQSLSGDGDRELAVHGVLEGQAEFVRLRATGGTLLPWEQMRDQFRQNAASMPVFNAAPPYFQELLLFPYISGADFVRRAYDRHPGASLYGADAPASTEQVLHDDRYFDKRDAPTTVTLPAPAGGTVVYQNTFGEFGTRLLIFEHTHDDAQAVRAAEGWDGDRFALLRTAKGDALVWVIVWDRDADASEFADAMDRAIDRRFATNITHLTKYSARAGGVLYKAPGRDLRVWSGTIAGRPATLYVDVPADEDTNVIDVGKVMLR